MFLRVARPHGPGLKRRSARVRAVAQAVCVLGGALAAGCVEPSVRGSGHLSWTVVPDPPRIGPAVLGLSLVDRSSRPVVGARWRIEGDMTHPGMQPILAVVAPVAPGSYNARLPFTMAGDWVLFVRADWGNGQWLQQSIPMRVGP